VYLALSQLCLPSTSFLCTHIQIILSIEQISKFVVIVKDSAGRNKLGCLSISFFLPILISDIPNEWNMVQALILWGVALHTQTLGMVEYVFQENTPAYFS
jgi:hypothetical protein